MMKRAKIAAFLALVAMAVSGTASAKEWFVDCNSKVSPATGSEGAPYVTIQQAINSASSGDVITVAPGVYQGDRNGKDGVTYSLVCVDAKALTIRSSGGASVTHIVGKHGPESPYYGLDDNQAVRCVRVTGGQPVTFAGFTFRDGATNTSSDKPRGLCAGVWNDAAADGNTASWNVTLVDCVVSNCVASRGPAVMGVVAVRTLFSNNFCYNATRPGYVGGSVARNASFYNCVFRDNRGSYVADQVADVVNCTVAGNELDNNGRVFAACASAGTKVYNTLIVNNRKQADTVAADGTVANCVFSAPCSGVTCVDSVTDAGDAQYQSYLDDDWRLAHGSVAITTGSTAWLDRIPADYRDKDFLGNARTTDGVVYVGAVQAVAPDVGGAIAVSDPSSVSIDGVLSPRAFCGAKYPFRRGTGYPHMFVLRADAAPEEGAELYGFKMSGAYDEPRFPFWNENKIAAWADMGFVPVMATPVWTKNVFNVASDGVIQPVINSCSSLDYAVIHVAAGDFKTNGENDAGVVNRVSFRNNCNIRLVGAGRGKTVIYGDKDPSTTTGEGSSAVRCVCFYRGISAVQGVTLKEGYSGTSGNYGIFGAVYSNEQGQGTVTDSEIRDCVATRGTIGYKTILERVTVTNCRATNSALARETILRCCHLYDNVLPCAGLISEGSEAYNCTVFANGVSILGRRAYFENCVLNNGTLSGSHMTAEPLHSEIIGCWFDSIVPTEDLQMTGWSAGDAHFYAKDTADGRLLSSSPAATCGCAGGLGFVKNASLDMDGNPVTVRNGRFAAGAWQELVLGVGGTVVDRTGKGAVHVNGTDAVCVAANEGDTVTVTVSGDRPFDHFVVDGVAVDPSVRSYAFKIASGWNGGPYGRVEAVFGTDWYVNAASSDGNNGGAPNDAKGSLQGALQHAVAGDVVHVAEGTYSGHAVMSTQSSKVYTQALVPSGVMLIASGAVEKTVILGADAPDPDEGGCGDGATRCAFLNNGSVLQGFTLRGGRTAAGNAADVDHYAGGVYCAYDTSLVKDCVITDCRSIRGAGGHGGQYVNCRFVGNKAYLLAPAVRYGILFGCYMADNIGNNTVNCLSGGVYNCTFGTGNLEKTTYTWGEGTGPANTVVADSGPVPLINCVFLSGCFHTTTVATNCVYDQAVEGRNGMAGRSSNCPVVPALAAQFADGKPLTKDVKSVDFGVLADLPDGMLTETDAAGGQRVYNAKIDAGAYEFDWREEFARSILRQRKLSVLSASPEVKLTTGGVYLPSGNLELVWQLDEGDASDHIAAFGVTGDGTLAVTQGEGPVALYTKGTYSETRALDVGENRFVFAYAPTAEDAGGALIGPFKRNCGFSLIIR